MYEHVGPPENKDTKNEDMSISGNDHGVFFLLPIIIPATSFYRYTKQMPREMKPEETESSGICVSRIATGYHNYR